MPTAVHTLEDVKITVEAFKNVSKKLKEGKYSATELATVKVDGQQ
jgi:glycine C-acetyltransferase